MKVDEDSPHSEHVKVLEALSSNLKSEVTRGLKLLDSCVTQIAQAKWILTNVDESLSGFSKGCPVCGILPDKEKQTVKSTKKDKQVSPISASPRRGIDSDITPVLTNSNKTTPPKHTANQQQRVASPSPLPAAIKAQHRIGPRSKTRPNEPVASTSMTTSSFPAPTPFPIITKQKNVTSSRLPKRLSIVISQTSVRVNLTDVKPYLRGHSVSVDLNNLNGFDSPVTSIPQDLLFKPKITRIKISKPKPTGPASRKFLESLQKFTTHDKPKVKKSSSKAVIHVFSSSDDEKSTKPSTPPSKKKKSSDSGSEYDYDFAKSTPVPSGASSSNNIKKKRVKMVGSHSHSSLKKRPRHHHLSSDSDEDYQYKKKKSSKSIFKKKMATSSESDSSDDSYNRKKKKKVKRKDSTDKEKEKRTSTSSKTHGSKTSSVLSSTRLTDDKKPHSSSFKSRTQRRESSASRGDSVTGSVTKSDAGREAIAKSDNPSSIKSGYKPGPASKRSKVNEAPTISGTKTKEVILGLEENDIEVVAVDKAKRGDIIDGTSNGIKEPGKVTPKPTQVDPFALLKQKLNEESATAAEGSAGDAVKKKLGVTGIMSMIKNNPNAKAALLAKLSLMKNKVPAPPKEKEIGNLTSSEPSVPVPVPVPAEECVEKANGETTQFGDDGEEDKEIELENDVIGKCFGDLGDENEVEADSTATLPPPSTVTPSPIPPSTLQDSVAPTAIDKFFENPEEEDTEGVAVKKIQALLVKLSNEVVDDTALLYNQEKMNELFGSSMTARNSEIETQRSDLQEGLWYIVKGQTIGRAVCSDTITEFEWNQFSAKELNEICTRLELYTDSYNP